MREREKRGKKEQKMQQKREEREGRRKERERREGSVVSGRCWVVHVLRSDPIRELNLSLVGSPRGTASVG